MKRPLTRAAVIADIGNVAFDGAGLPQDPTLQAALTLSDNPAATPAADSVDKNIDNQISEIAWNFAASTDADAAAPAALSVPAASESAALAGSVGDPFSFSVADASAATNAASPSDSAEADTIDYQIFNAGDASPPVDAAGAPLAEAFAPLPSLVPAPATFVNLGNADAGSCGPFIVAAAAGPFAAPQAAEGVTAYQSYHPETRCSCVCGSGKSGKSRARHLRRANRQFRRRRERGHRGASAGGH